MIKKIFLYIALLMSFAACSDDIFDGPRETLPENGEIPVAFSIPDMQTEQTRAGIAENEIGTVYMLAYQQKNGELAFATPLTLDENNQTKITIPSTYRTTGSLYFLFFVNDNRTDATFTSNSDKNISVATEAENGYITVTGGSNNQDRMTMTGAASLSSLLQLTPIALHRNAAKVTVAPEETGSSVKFEYEVYGTAKTSKFMAGASNAGSDSPYNAVTNYCSNPVKVTEFVDFGSDHSHNVDATTYLHPTYNTGGTSLNASYIMVRAKSTEDDAYYYYRLNFQNQDEGVMDILPNHHYEVKIKSGKIGKGYTTQEEAADNPVPLESGAYVIYDHSPKVFNIVTDGVRALGVSDKVSTSGTGNTETAYLYVKLFSSTDKADEEYADFEENYNNYIKFADDSWISVIGIAEASGEELGTVGQNSVKVDNVDYSDGGNGGQYKVYRITCTLKKSGAGSQSTTGTVTWKGLSRKFDVEWDRSFKASDLYSSVSVSFSGNTYGSNPTIAQNNYFEWLGGEVDADGIYTTTPKVWGADKKSNNGDARDQGFHFPMKGGGSVTYTIELNDLGGGSEYKWSYSYEGDDVGCSLKVNNAELAQNTKQSMNAGAKPKFTLSGGNDNFNYGVANLVIRVETSSARDVQYYRIPLYHTGFFMDANETSGENRKYTEKGIGLAKKLETGRDYTYYEVVTINRDGRVYHMLDRNLGAHSAEMYVEATGDVTYAGNPQAAGGYYRVALYDKLKKPIVKTEEIGAPAGFEIPQKEVFDDIRNSSNFSMAAVGNYYTSLYAGDYYGPEDEDGNRKRKYTYFPKSRYLDANNSKVGDSRAGYYWTSTASSGLEKEDVGAWLDCLQLSGSASAYMRGEVYCSTTSTSGNSVRTGEINGYAMPVRLILGDDNSAGSSVYQTKFFVKGATHVYLYTVDKNGNRTALTSWPGYAICTASTATNVYNFLYESKINKTEDLYAIFNFKSTSGAIFSMSYNASDIKKGRFTNTTNPKDLIGFNLDGVAQTQYGYNNGLAPDFTSEAVYGTGTKEVKNGVTWGFVFDTSDNYATASKGGIGEGTPEPPQSKDYRIYFPSDFTEFWLWFKDGGTHLFKDANGNDMNALNSSNKENGYYYADFKHTGDEDKMLQFSGGGTDGTHNNKDLNKALKDFQMGDDGKYYAWIDTDDVFHDGKPTDNGGDNEDVYYQIKGNIFTGSWSGVGCTEKLTKKSGTNIWEGQFSVSAGEFGIEKMDNGNSTWYGGNSTTVSTGTYNTSSGGNFKISAGTYYFSFDADSSKLTVTEIKDIYVFGEIKGYGWDASKGRKMTFANGVYTAEVEFESGDKNFRFVTKLGSSSGDWGTVNGATQYGPSSQTAITLNTLYSFIEKTGEASNFKWNGEGKYKIELNLSTKQIKLTKSSSVRRRPAAKAAVRKR